MSGQVQRRRGWRTKFGFYLIAIGSAFGLGNLWRFPYVVGENGGGAFVLLYLFVAMVIGLPLLVGELMLGKSSRKSIMVALRDLSSRSIWLGAVSVLLSLIVLSYYSVISGWVLHYLMQFVGAIFSGTEAISDSPFRVLTQNLWLQLLLASAHLLMCLVVVGQGVQEGIEKWINYVMPLFATMVLLLVAKSLSFGGTADVLRFLFYPDFSKLQLSSLAEALGHVFFTLSVGFGTMVTFGSYMKDGDHAPTMGYRVAVVDTSVSLISALLVFPIAFSLFPGSHQDPSLVFEVLPNFLLIQKAGVFFGTVFFASFYLAALNASIGLLEAVVSNFCDVFPGLRRGRAAWLSGLFCFLLISFGALLHHSYSGTDLQAKNRAIVLIDRILVNWALPITVLIFCWVYVRVFPKASRKEQFVDPQRFASVVIYPYWENMIRYVVPGVIIFALVLQAWQQLSEI